eukprot:2888337-Rhodomonas_salina.1
MLYCPVAAVSTKWNSHRKVRRGRHQSANDPRGKMTVVVAVTGFDSNCRVGEARPTVALRPVLSPRGAAPSWPLS